MPAQSQGHGTIGAQLRQVKLRVASRQINTVDRGQFTVSEWREKDQFSSHHPQQVEVGRVKKGESRVSRNTDAYTGQHSLG